MVNSLPNRNCKSGAKPKPRGCLSIHPEFMQVARSGRLGGCKMHIVVNPLILMGNLTRAELGVMIWAMSSWFLKVLALVLSVWFAGCAPLCGDAGRLASADTTGAVPSCHAHKTHKKTAPAGTAVAAVHETSDCCHDHSAGLVPVTFTAKQVPVSSVQFAALLIVIPAKAGIHRPASVGLDSGPPGSLTALLGTTILRI